MKTSWEIREGDVLERLAEMPDGSVQCVVTSPPYWGLRDYGVDGAYGLEATPAEYVAKMVKVFAEVRRVLRDDGTCWLNLGDSYGSGGSGGSGAASSKQTTNQGSYHPTTFKVPSKQLVGIPWRVAFALQEDGWWLRSDIVWSKPNPMPESVTDRPSRSHEYVFLLTKSARYWYDADAVRTPLAAKTLTTFGTQRRQDTGDGSGLVKSENYARDVPTRRPRLRDKQRGHGRRHAGFNDRWDAMTRDEQMYAGANLRSVWEIATQPYKEAHFATFPEKLPMLCIKAGSREGDVVLDPFCGAGTTGLVARKLGRDFIGIELNPTYCDMARKRIDAKLPANLWEQDPE